MWTEKLGTGNALSIEGREYTTTFLYELITIAFDLDLLVQIPLIPAS